MAAALKKCPALSFHSSSLRHSCRVTMLISYNIMSMPVIPNLQKYPGSTITLGASLMDTSGLTDIMHMHVTNLLTAIGFACQNLRSMSQMMKERQPWRPCMSDAGEEVRRIMLSSGGARCPRIHTNSLSWPLLFTSLYYSRPRPAVPFFNATDIVFFREQRGSLGIRGF